MSVDVAGELARPVSLASVLSCAADALGALLGVDAVPALEVTGGWRAGDHRRDSPGRALEIENPEATVIGNRIPADAGQIAGSLTFEVGIAGAEDRAFVLVIDFTGVAGLDPRVEAVVSPTRTCAGVVLATAVAPGAAIASGGEFVDAEIMMADAATWDPARFIDVARLSAGGGDFAERCERFMRQFPQLKGWPKERSTF